MDLSKQMTNEQLTKKFDNSFDLVTHAIHLAQQIVKAGHPIVSTSVGVKNQNQAFKILTLIATGEDEIESIIEAEKEVASQESASSTEPQPAPAA